MKPEPVSIPSPCTSVCKMDPHTGWCEGCLRTLDEIAAWSTMPSRQKLAVWRALAQRRTASASKPAPG